MTMRMATAAATATNRTAGSLRRIAHAVRRMPPIVGADKPDRIAVVTRLSLACRARDPLCGVPLGRGLRVYWGRRWTRADAYKHTDAAVARLRLSALP